MHHLFLVGLFWVFDPLANAVINLLVEFFVSVQISADFPQFVPFDRNSLLRFVGSLRGRVLGIKVLLFVSSHLNKLVKGHQTQVGRLNWLAVDSRNELYLVAVQHVALFLGRVS